MAASAIHAVDVIWIFLSHVTIAPSVTEAQPMTNVDIIARGKKLKGGRRELEFILWE
jgi:hypothetical protein